MELVKEKYVRVLKEYKNFADSNSAKAFREACDEVPIFKNVPAATVFEIIQDEETLKEKNTIEMELKRLLKSVEETEICEHDLLNDPKPEDEMSSAESLPLSSSAVDHRLKKRIEEGLSNLLLLISIYFHKLIHSYRNPTSRVHESNREGKTWHTRRNAQKNDRIRDRQSFPRSLLRSPNFQQPLSCSSISDCSRRRESKQGHSIRRCF